MRATAWWSNVLPEAAENEVGRGAEEGGIPVRCALRIFCVLVSVRQELIQAKGLKERYRRYGSSVMQFLTHPDPCLRFLDPRGLGVNIVSVRDKGVTEDM